MVSEQDFKDITREEIIEASGVLKKTGCVKRTPLELNEELSKEFKCNVYIKREDYQINGSFKVRGALYNIIQQIKGSNGVEEFVCASAGNHSQGFAIGCVYAKKRGIIFMPSNAAPKKISETRRHGKAADGTDYIEIRLIGDTFDEAQKAAYEYADETGAKFIHPFDDRETIVGQGMVAFEVDEDLKGDIDYFYAPVGGGGLLAGASSYFAGRDINKPKIIGSEPINADSVTLALFLRKPEKISKNFDTYVDGAAVGKAGHLTTRILLKNRASMVSVNNDQTNYALAKLYRLGINAELAGALTLAAILNHSNREELVGKNVVIVLSGKNIDQERHKKIIEDVERRFTKFPFTHNVPKYDPDDPDYTLYTQRKYAAAQGSD